MIYNLQMLVNIEYKKIQQKYLKNIRIILIIKVSKNMIYVFIIIKDIKKQQKKLILDQKQHKLLVKINIRYCKTFTKK